MVAMKQLLDTASQTLEELHILESDVKLLRVPDILRRDFQLTRAKMDLQEILHRKNYRFVHLESERSRCFISYHHRETSMLTRYAMNMRNVRVPLW